MNCDIKKEGPKRFAVSGMIAAGKTTLIKDVNGVLGKRMGVYYEDVDLNVLKRYYQAIELRELKKPLCLVALVVVVAFSVMCFIAEFLAEKSYLRLLIITLITSFLSSSVWIAWHVIDFYASSIYFSTQIYFLNNRKKRERKRLSATEGVALIGEDKSFLEDKLFPAAQLKTGILSRYHFDIYNDFFEEYAKDLDDPDLWIYLDITPETSLKNIKKRGRESEDLITLDYLKALAVQYDKWKSEMEEKHKDKFIIIDNNDGFLSAGKVVEILKEKELLK
jgi:deoxyadenosine/deoxycytidine kinase